MDKLIKFYYDDWSAISDHFVDKIDIGIDWGMQGPWINRKSTINKTYYNRFNFSFRFRYWTVGVSFRATKTSYRNGAEYLTWIKNRRNASK